ncbi:stage IV sporulation protein B [Clostridium algifaecis]|uniref:Stage IV sporulation protein B n=1 Tax=Clostridium algifaecis TaxID=1472040 RepID=A0ABS4KN80_9CLOT|nr:SpoIVB peptidase [Clostridium algifaecis]MBP2031486.1 stage IV sporulation protein B [Clostridium algifaecis]
MEKKSKKMLYYMLIPMLFIMLFIYYEFKNIPTVIFLKENQSIKQNIFLKVNGNKKSKKNASINLLGIVPVGSVSIKPVKSDILLYPGGQPVGVKLNTKGVLVVALSDITTIKGKAASPAAVAGIQIGDNILKMNETIIKDAEQTKNIVNESNGQNITVLIERKGQKLKKIIKPVKSMDGDNYKIGLWIRDSTAGIGTLTFYDKNSKMFAALGHPIMDIDTGTILNINSGQVVSSSIVSVKKGIKGNPGELKGIFVNEDSVLGNIYKNTECGIFGKGKDELQNNSVAPMKIGLRNEIKEGPAKILTTIDKDGVKAYDIRIDKLLAQDSPGPKSMVIKVTDKELLEKTGGIVQGMSGSPIIQNGKIVGAVTHVLVNKPDVGYGIYIEWMLSDANLLMK